MPTYEYKCNNCGAEYELIHNIHELVKICKECSKETLERLISLTSFKLLGTGWYQTDYKNK